MQYDLIVVGGGHAGVEAAAVGSRMGLRVALVTFDPRQIGAMSCNPAIGGLGKGHLVREIDALDGVIARAADDAAVHYRMLNRSKGSAVWGPRVQADRRLFRESVQRQLAAMARLDIVRGEVAGLRLAGDAVRGVILVTGEELLADRVVLCTGTFLGGVMFRGEERVVGGRTGEQAASVLASQLREARLPMGRLKTGTPPRLDGRTIDWARLERQPSDGERWTMSSLTRHRANPQLHCAITRTNARTHSIVRDHLHQSPLFSGAIDALGPRYCPSIEDKIHRFADRDHHQIFLEPEGLDSPLIYPNGISTSLPGEAQNALVRSIEGLENAITAMPGYAVEYDHIDPRALGRDLQLRAIKGLYCAGQINGTTGYEEAAAQGLVAGLHAACEARQVAPPELDRANSYLAVMVDDLTLQGVTEPYRMLTSRAEYRLRLRASNADSRLTPLGIAAGCVSPGRKAWFAEREECRARLQSQLDQPHSAPEPGGNTKSVREVIGAGHLDFGAIRSVIGSGASNSLLEEVIEDARYAPYLVRQDRELQDMRAARSHPLPADLDYRAIPGLSKEMTERLLAARPQTMADAALMRGITPAALAALLVHARKHTRLHAAA